MPSHSYKRWLLSITLVVAQYHLCNAQNESSKAQFNFGLTTGINLTALKVQHTTGGGYPTVNIPDHKSQLGYQVGLPFKITWNRFFISGSVLFVLNNSQLVNKDEPNNTLYQTDNRLHWINVPLHFNYIINPQSKQQFFAGLGFSTGKLLKSSTRISTDFGTITTNGPYIDTYDSFKAWSFFGTAQVGSNLLVAKRIPITLALSYDHSLNNLMGELPNNSNLIFDYGFVQTKARMNSAALSISYFIK